MLEKCTTASSVSTPSNKPIRRFCRPSTTDWTIAIPDSIDEIKDLQKRAPKN